MVPTSANTLEVQLPFLQRVLGDFRFVPIVVGAVATETVRDLLVRVWSDDVLVVISTDLSHYHDHATARRMDGRTATAISTADHRAIDPAGACGFYPLRGLLELVTDRGLQIEQLDLRNSGDTAGGRDRVVGYGAFAVIDRVSAREGADSSSHGTIGSPEDGHERERASTPGDRSDPEPTPPGQGTQPI
jgi:AmmeMemoRadiSam system protein B